MKKSLLILGQLSDEDVEWIIESEEKCFLHDGHISIKQDEPIEVMYITLKGEFEILNEKNNFQIARIGSGEIVGEMSYVNDSPPSATVKAIGESIVHSISRDALTRKISSDTAFGMRFYKALATMLSDRLRQSQSSENEETELDLAIIDKLHLAGARFERILKKFEINE